MVQIPTLVIAMIDLSNATEQIPQIEKMLEAARNNKISFIPVKMEAFSQVYYMETNLNTYVGLKYEGLTDDRRAIRAFIGESFKRIAPILPGRDRVVIYHSADYEKEAVMLEALVKGQRLQMEVVRTTEGYF